MKEIDMLARYVESSSFQQVDYKQHNGEIVRFYIQHKHKVDSRSELKHLLANLHQEWAYIESAIEKNHVNDKGYIISVTYSVKPEEINLFYHHVPIRPYEMVKQKGVRAI